MALSPALTSPSSPLTLSPSLPALDTTMVVMAPETIARRVIVPAPSMLMVNTVLRYSARLIMLIWLLREFLVFLLDVSSGGAGC